MAQRERSAAPDRNDSADKLAPFSGLSSALREAQWLIKNFDQDKRDRWDHYLMISTTIYAQQFDEGAAR